MRVFVISALTALYLYGAGGDTQGILNEVAKLRQKYEECRQGQSAVVGVEPKQYEQCESERKSATGKIKGYQSRIANLENEIKVAGDELLKLKKRNDAVERELSQKKGVIASLETTLTSRDKKYREAVALNEALNAETNKIKVSRIERQKLTNSLVSTKNEVERLQSLMAKSQKERSQLERQLTDAKAQIDRIRHERVAPVKETKEVQKVVASSDQNGQIKALQDELKKANALILQLQNTPAPSAPKEKIVTKVVEPTDKIVALQRELAIAQSTIINLKNNANTAKSQTIVEKVVYKDRPVEKIVEKVVYKERPAEKTKVITKVVEPTDKIIALQRELAAAQSTIVNLKNNANTAKSQTIVEKVIYKDRPVEKVVYKERPVEKIVEKVIYKDRPVVQEKIVTKVVEPTEKIKALEAKLAKYEKQSSQTQKLPPPKLTRIAAETASESNMAKTQSSSSPSKKGASAYRMAVNAPIYNAPGGRQIDTWENRRSFTAGAPEGEWVHITGYFVNRVWQPTQENEHLWVRLSDVIRR